MTITLLLLHLLVAVLVLYTRDLVNMVIHMGVLSLLSSLLFFHLHAPDVALTEAAVGAGIATFLLVWIIRVSRKRDNA